MSTPSRKRLMRDFKRLQQDPPAGISGAPQDNNIMLWNAVIFGWVESNMDGRICSFRYFLMLFNCFFSFLGMFKYCWISYFWFLVWFGLQSWRYSLGWRWVNPRSESLGHLYLCSRWLLLHLSYYAVHLHSRICLRSLYYVCC